MTAELEPEALQTTVDRARSGDPDAWELLYRHCYPKLLNYAQRRLHPKHAAEDAVSEAMMRAVQGIDRFTWQGAGFDAWMYGILRNVVLESQRKLNRSEQLLQRNTADVDLRVPSDATIPELAAELADDASHVRIAFATLSSDDQELLELRVVGELSAADVALVLDKNPGTVRMAQSRALGRLRSAMEAAGHA